MASARRSRRLKVVIVVAVACVVVLVGVYLYRLWIANPLSRDGPARPPVAGVDLFPFEYASHVSSAEGSPLDITRWYAPESVRPDLAKLRGSLRLPSFEEWSDGDLPFRDVVIETNLEYTLLAPCFSAEAGLYRRVSKPGENPAFASTPDGEVYSHVLRHDPGLTRREARLTFELQGIDPETGAARRERHHVRLVENPKAGDDRGWVIGGEPAFLISSHTIEELPADRTD